MLSMKQMKYIVTLLMIVLLGGLAGCKQTTEQTPATVLLVDDAQIAQPDEKVSKVNKTGFDVGDSMAFYAVRFTGTNPNPIGADATTYLNHKLYIKRASDLLFASWDGAVFVNEYFPNDGSSIDIYGFYPYTATAPTDYTNYNVAVRANQSGANKWDYNQSDFMAAKNPAIKPTAVPNKLVFKHLLSRMVINVNLANFPANSVVQEVKLLSVNTHTRFNLREYDATTGTVGRMLSSSIPTHVTPYVERTPATGFSYTSVAIVAPQALTANKQLGEISVWDGAKITKYNLILEQALTLEQGKEYTFSLLIDHGSRPDINIQPAITAWGTLTASGETVKSSDHKFVTSLANVGGVAIGQVTQVKVGVNGNRTFTLPATYSATAGAGGQNAVLWEFRGSGNRPIEYPFDIRTLEFLSAAGASLGGVHTASLAPIQIQASDASETVAVGLNLDMTAKTFTR